MANLSGTPRKKLIFKTKLVYTSTSQTMGRDPEWGRETLLLRSCCMAKTKYLDIFNVKLIDYPFPRNVYLQSIDRSRCFEISNDELQYNQSQQSMRCCIVIAATSGKKVTLLLALRFQSSLICEKTFLLCHSSC